MDNKLVADVLVDYLSGNSSINNGKTVADIVESTSLSMSTIYRFFREESNNLANYAIARAQKPSYPMSYYVSPEIAQAIRRIERGMSPTAVMAVENRVMQTVKAVLNKASDHNLDALRIAFNEPPNIEKILSEMNSMTTGGEYKINVLAMLALVLIDYCNKSETSVAV